MEAVLLWNLPRECLVALVDLVITLEEVLLLGLDAASTVELMVTGLGIAKLEIGRISVIAVANEAT